MLPWDQNAPTPDHAAGVPISKDSASFMAVRVVIVRFDDGGWAAYFCTDAKIEVRDILETVAARWAIEEPANTLMGHDVKEIWGSRSAAGSQHLVEHRLLASESVDVYAGGVVLVGCHQTQADRPQPPSVG